MINPFIFNGYQGADFFFDREQELGSLLKYVSSGINVTLMAQRRLGKTGLIYRLMDELKTTESKVTSIYIDIFATRNIEEFNKSIADAIINKFPSEDTIGHKLFNILKGFRPLLGIDPLTGTPQVQFSYQNQTEKEHTLEGLLLYLEQQEIPVLLAIDEFQQIRDYPETNIEALLRTYIQQLHNVSFIFCGSKKHMMADIFSNPQRPFFSSTQFIGLDTIPPNKYAVHIRQMFENDGRHIDDDAVNFILTWTKCHTYYTQRLCHDVFDLNSNNIDIVQVKACCDNLLKLNEPYFLQYKQLITDGQWKFMIAMAKEEVVTQPYANAFLKKYNLGATAVARRQLQTLIDKDLIFEETTKEGSYYRVADVFLLRWLEREY